MTDRRRTILRSIMVMAWDSRRADPARSFADCLKGAWAFSKRMDRACRKFMARAKANGMTAALSPDLTRSPIRRTLIGQRYAGHRAYQAAYATAAVGR